MPGTQRIPSVRQPRARSSRNLAGVADDVDACVDFGRSRYSDRASDDEIEFLLRRVAPVPNDDDLLNFDVLSEFSDEKNSANYIFSPMSQRTTYDSRRSVDPNSFRSSLMSEGRNTADNDRPSFSRGNWQDRVEYEEDRDSFSRWRGRIEDEEDLILAPRPDFTYVAGAASILRGRRAGGERGALVPEDPDFVEQNDLLADLDRHPCVPSVARTSAPRPRLGLRRLRPYRAAGRINADPSLFQLPLGLDDFAVPYEAPTRVPTEDLPLADGQRSRASSVDSSWCGGFSRTVTQSSLTVDRHCEGEVVAGA